MAHAIRCAAPRMSKAAARKTPNAQTLWLDSASNDAITAMQKPIAARIQPTVLTIAATRLNRMQSTQAIAPPATRLAINLPRPARRRKVVLCQILSYWGLGAALAACTSIPGETLTSWGV